MSNSFAKKINSVKDITERRKKYFDLYFGFTLDSDQWYTKEIQELKARNVSPLTFNFSEEYFEEYLSRLFPRNPHTGVLEVGVSVLEKNPATRQKFETKILSEYELNDLPDKLLEQAQDFLIGGAAAFYYPPDGYAGCTIISLNPRYVYLGWSNNILRWFAFYDEDTKTYTFVDNNVIANLDQQLKLIKSQKNSLGFIPFSWIPNMPKAHTREGRTKIASLFPLERAYNLAMTNYSERADENTIPHRVVSDDNADTKNISRGKGKTTVLSSNGKMQNLELQEGSELLNFNEKILERMRGKASLVDSYGSIRSSVSGVSLSYQFSGMLDKISFMRVYWDKFFKELNHAILTYAYTEKDYKTKPVYHRISTLDETDNVDNVIKQVENKIMSRREAIDTLRGSYSSDEKLEEIQAELKKYPDLSKTKNEDNNLNNKKIVS